MAEIRKVEIDGVSYDIVGQGMPSGGSTGKVLKKASGNDYDTEWADETGSDVPSGGTTGQVLTKASNDDGDVEWATKHEIPTGGASGQVLKKSSGTDYDVEWADEDNPSPYPTGGGTGQVLAKASGTTDDVTWRDVHELPAGGTAGYVLQKATGSDYDVEWVSNVGKIPVGGSAGQFLMKNSDDNYDVSWANGGSGGGGGGGGTAEDIFIVNYYSTPYTTYAEALAAYQAGKRLVLHTKIGGTPHQYGNDFWCYDYEVRSGSFAFYLPIADYVKHMTVLAPGSQYFPDEYTTSLQDWSDELTTSNWKPVQGRVIKNALDSIGFSMDANGILSAGVIAAST